MEAAREQEALLLSELQDLGIEVKVNQQQYIDNLLQVGRELNLTAEDLANEWVSFSQNDRCSLDAPSIEKFSMQIKHRNKTPVSAGRSKSRLQTTPSSVKVYDKESLHLLFGMEEINNSVTGEDDEELSIISAYGGSGNDISLAEIQRGSKRSLSPPVTPVSSKSRYNSINRAAGRGRNGGIELMEDHSPADVTDTPTTKYINRNNSGKVICSFNELAVQKKWVESRSIVTIDFYNPDSALREVPRHMYQIPMRKRAILVDRLEELGQKICQSNGIPEIAMETSLATATTEPTLFVGRVLCEGEGRLNSQSCILEGVESFQPNLRHKLVHVTMEIPNGLHPCSLFPGQVIAVEGTINHSGVLFPQRIFDNGSLPSPSLRKKKGKLQTLSGIIAAGPFTVADNLDMTPLHDLLDIVLQQKPHLLLLMGPFIDMTHSSLKECELEVTFQEILVGKIMLPLKETCRKSNTRVVVVPSQKDVCHQWPIYPQPPYFTVENSPIITNVSDPCTFCLSDITFGVSSTDILFHLSSRSMFVGPPGDRMSRLATHILQQQSYYPLYPPYIKDELTTNKSSNSSDHTPYMDNLPEVNMDMLLAYEKGHVTLPVKPDLLILPSTLKPFVKVIEGCLCINPGHITKKAGGGTYGKFAIPERSGADRQLISDLAGIQILHI